MQYSDVLMRWLLEKTERSKECYKEASQEDQMRRDTIIRNNMEYQVGWWVWLLVT